MKRGSVVSKTWLGRAVAAAAIACGAQAAPAATIAKTVEYYHLDGLGSARAVSDSAGALVPAETRDYLPFGEEWCATAPCGAVTPGQPRRFTGKERDAETGLDYFGARYYGARLARFTTMDPAYNWQESLPDPQRWNRYAYGLNNPFRYLDPDGRDAIWVKHGDGSATLVIPVKFTGASATEENVAAIVARANNLTILDAKVTIHVVATDDAIEGKLNTMDFSAGPDNKLCGKVGECVNKMGGTKGHIDSSQNQAVGAAAHDILHFAGVRDAYKEGKDAEGRRKTTPLPGFTESNIMADRRGTELKGDQLKKAQRNRSTKKCEGEGTTCK